MGAETTPASEAKTTLWMYHGLAASTRTEMGAAGMTSPATLAPLNPAASGDKCLKALTRARNRRGDAIVNIDAEEVPREVNIMDFGYVAYPSFKRSKSTCSTRRIFSLYVLVAFSQYITNCCFLSLACDDSLYIQKTPFYFYK